MKTFIALMIFSSALIAAPVATKKAQPVKKEVEVVKKTESKPWDKKEEDCDDKAKKPIEIKPEAISLSGNTGCSLDEAQ